VNTFGLFIRDQTSPLALPLELLRQMDGCLLESEPEVPRAEWYWRGDDSKAWW